MTEGHDIRIRELQPVDGDVDTAARILRRAFATVAKRFGLTKENCPRSPAFATRRRVREEMQRGVRYYLLEVAAEARGCVALEHARREVVYLERLGVLPEHGAKGYGKALVHHVLAQATSLGARRVEIGIIAADTHLKNWYGQFGFEETGTKTFDHLPFVVGFLARKL
jgi:N-acetylglutamate synthase-like GNAT family acetyltransferase